MAVNKKGLRKVKAQGRLFYWRVEDTIVGLPEQGFVRQAESRRVVHIISSNKQFIVHYTIPRSAEDTADLRIEGALFPRAPGAKRIQIPRWRHDSKRYPTANFVRRLIDYCFQES